VQTVLEEDSGQTDTNPHCRTLL